MRLNHLFNLIIQTDRSFDLQSTNNGYYSGDMKECYQLIDEDWFFKIIGMAH